MHKMRINQPERSAPAGVSRTGTSERSFRFQRSGLDPYGYVVRAAGLFLITWAVFYIIRSVTAGIWFDGSPADGPFSVFNSLRRLDAGQRVGIDIPSYHGVGVPLIHYPIFILLGRTITASEISRNLVSFLAFIAPLVCFFYAASRNRRSTIVCTAVAVLAMESLFRTIAGPGNSMIVLRSMMPVLVFAIWLTKISDSAKALLVGSCMALAFLFGFEQGIALILAVVSVSAVLMLGQVGCRSDFSRTLRFTGIAIPTAIAAASLALIAICGAVGMKTVLRYFLVELPMDKFWYDGSPPNPFLGTWRELVTSRHHLFPFLPALAATVLALVMLPKLLKTKLRITDDWRVLALIMLTYGILSSVSLMGMLGIHYTVPVCRVLVLVSLLAIIRTQRIPLVVSDANRVTFLRPIASGLVVVCLISTCVVVAASIENLRAVAKYRGSQHVLYSRNLRARWDRYMLDATKVIESNRRTAGPLSLWSTYAGMLESHYGIFHPVADYMTLEVGPERRRNYQERFRQIQPEFVQTIAPKFFVYEEWLQNVNWPFYEDVLDNYLLVGETDHSLLWHRGAAEWVTPPQNYERLAVDGRCACIVLPRASGPEQIAVVRLAYSVQNRWHSLPLLGNTPRYLVTPEGSRRHLAVSLAPYEHEVRFPVELRSDQPIRLHLETRSLLPAAAVQVTSAEFRMLSAPDAARAIAAPRN